MKGPETYFQSSNLEIKVPLSDPLHPVHHPILRAPTTKCTQFWHSHCSPSQPLSSVTSLASYSSHYSLLCHQGHQFKHADIFILLHWLKFFSLPIALRAKKKNLIFTILLRLFSIWLPLTSLACFFPPAPSPLQLLKLFLLSSCSPFWSVFHCL